MIPASFCPTKPFWGNSILAQALPSNAGSC